MRLGISMENSGSLEVYEFRISRARICVVEVRGIEPLASALRTQRSPI
jgi:hypothetical protein